MDWNSQLGGIIIGALIAGGFSFVGVAITVWSQNRRTKKQLKHDREKWHLQFQHEQEQEIRGRRTEALVDLQALLENQVDALSDLWGHAKAGTSIDDLRTSEQLGVLVRREYRSRLWPVNTPVSHHINAFADTCKALQIRLVAGDAENIEKEFSEVSGHLSAALKEIGVLLSTLNGINVGDHEAQRDSGTSSL